MLTVNHWIELGVLDRGTGEGTEGAEDMYCPIWGATVSTSQTLRDWTTNQIEHMQELMGPDAQEEEDGLVRC